MPFSLAALERQVPAMPPPARPVHESTSLPSLKWPNRAAPPSYMPNHRAGVIQREFEALSRKLEVASPPQRTRVLVLDEVTGGTPAEATPAPMTPLQSQKPATPPQPPITPPSFGSIVNMLELRVAEAKLQRHQSNTSGAVQERMLESSSRVTSESCLLALRQLASVTSPKLGPILQRVADALEPALFSAQHRDTEGHRLTYEQVVKLVLAPKVADETERGDDAEATRDRWQEQLQLEEAISISLRRNLGEQTKALNKLEEQYHSLQAEAASAKRAFQYELEAQVMTPPEGPSAPLNMA